MKVFRLIFIVTLFSIAVKLVEYFKIQLSLPVKIICMVLTLLVIIILCFKKDKVKGGNKKELSITKKNQSNEKTIYIISPEDFGYTLNYTSFDTRVVENEYNSIFIKKQGNKFYELTTNAIIKFSITKAELIDMDRIYMPMTASSEKLKNDYYRSPIYSVELKKFIEQQNKKYDQD